jgi:hypothetical protein
MGGQKSTYARVLSVETFPAGCVGGLSVACRCCDDFAIFNPLGGSCLSCPFIC